MHDEEPALVYYNYRFYNPRDGRWINRDSIAEDVYKRQPLMPYDPSSNCSRRQFFCQLFVIPAMTPLLMRFLLL